MAITYEEAWALLSKSGLCDGPAHNKFDKVKGLIEANPVLIEAMNAVNYRHADEAAEIPQCAAAYDWNPETLLNICAIKAFVSTRF